MIAETRGAHRHGMKRTGVNDYNITGARINIGIVNAEGGGSLGDLQQLHMFVPVQIKAICLVRGFAFWMEPNCAFGIRQREMFVKRLHITSPKQYCVNKKQNSSYKKTVALDTMKVVSNMER